MIRLSRSKAELSTEGPPADGKIRLSGVNRRYRGRGTVTVTALADVDLEIESGEVVAVVGPSGSGKSSLLHLIGGMDRPDAGEVLVGGQRIDRMSSRDLAIFRREVGFVFQRFHLLPALSVTDNVLAPLVPRRVEFDRRARATELLQAVGMHERGDALPSQLSGGQQQRVAIARALIASPRLVLADEPTGSLDSTTGRAVMDLMLRLTRGSGRTLVVATHNLEIAGMCDRAVHMRDGCVATDN